MYFFDCQADFDVDNVQRRELVNIYGVKRYIRVIIIIIIIKEIESEKDGEKTTENLYKYAELNQRRRLRETI